MFSRNKCYWLLTILLLLVMAVSVGCPGGGGGEKKPAPQQGPKIGVSVADMERDGNRTIHKVFNESKKQDRAQLTWLDAGGDSTQQQKDIQTLIEEKVAVVVLQMTDPEIGPDLVRQLTQNNIKVIALETLPVNTPVDGYITSDHSRAGSLQVQYIENIIKEGRQQVQEGEVLLNPQPPQEGQQGEGEQQQMVIPPEQQAAVGLQDGGPFRVVVLQGDGDDQMARAITGAVHSGLQGLENVEVVLSQVHDKWEADLAKATMQQLLEVGTKIDAVLANDSQLAMAAAEVLKQFNMEGRVITVGVGADPRAIKALMAGEHDAEVDNRPDMLAQLAYEAAVNLAQGKSFQYDTRINNGNYTVPAKVVPPRLIDQDNLYLLQDRMEDMKDMKDQQGRQEQGEKQNKDGEKQKQNQDQGQAQNQEGGQQQSTLRITTNDGKVVEVQIDGEIQSIEAQPQNGGGQQAGQEQGGQGQGGSDSGSGSGS
ncbi:sugar ABC transporter substrate-binding protein [Desulfofalx alkaliphila]|uniref:sugar ABC transporter substrate-binding protein n=1 Tax=Desulfofalx alkaliphila TaxID=105483 RepID=UPI000557C5DD|nr:substrate-binding domain-containing protein [Desulfofalx alkaliphila]